MARQRFIWPEIWKDPIFGRLAPAEMVFFIACFSLADDEGRLLADPAYLRSEMFPYKDFTSKKVQTLRDGVVAKVESVHLYVAQSQEYIALLRWNEYQRPKYPKASKIPPPFLQASPKPAPSLTETGATGWVGLDRDGLEKTSKPTSVDKVRDEFLQFSGEIGFHGKPYTDSLELPPDLMEEAMRRVRSRGDVSNRAAYFTTVTRNLLAAQKAWRSRLPLEDRLLTYVKNVGWEYTDAELRDELRKKNVTDTALVGRLVEYANELRSEAA